MKKKAFQKLTALVAVTAMSASLLTGCGSDASGSNDAATNNAQESAASVGTQEANSEHPSWISEDPLEIGIMVMDSSQQPMAQDSKSHEAIFEATNVKLDFQIVPSSSYDEKKNIALSTQNFPDIIYLRSASDISDFASEGIFEPLSQYINEETMPNFYKFWQQYPEMQRYMVDGEMYVFPVVLRDEWANGFGPVIRTDLLEENGIATPTTWDEVLDALAQLKEIYPDSTPWAIRKGTANLLKTTSYMLGSGFGSVSASSGMYWDEDLGKYVYGPADTNFKEVLKFLNKAYTTGVLDQEYATTDSDSMTTKCSSGQSFFFVDNSGFGQNYTNELRKIAGNENATFQVLPIPENSLGERRAVSYDTRFGKLYAINANAKNKDQIIKFIDWMYSMEASDITNYGIEGETFQYNADGEAEYISDYVMQFKDASPSDYYACWTDIGAGKLDFSMYACNIKTQREIQMITGSWSDLTEDYWKIINDDDAYVQPHIAPSFPTEEADRVKELTTDLDTFFTQEYDKYITGKESIDNWDALIKKAEDMGVRELEQLWNDAEARAVAGTK